MIRTLRTRNPALVPPGLARYYDIRSPLLSEVTGIPCGPMVWDDDPKVRRDWGYLAQWGKHSCPLALRDGDETPVVVATVLERRLVEDVLRGRYDDADSCPFIVWDRETSDAADGHVPWLALRRGDDIVVVDAVEQINHLRYKSTHFESIAGVCAEHGWTYQVFDLFSPEFHQLREYATFELGVHGDPDRITTAGAVRRAGGR